MAALEEMQTIHPVSESFLAVLMGPLASGSHPGVDGNQTDPCRGVAQDWKEPSLLRRIADEREHQFILLGGLAKCRKSY